MSVRRGLPQDRVFNGSTGFVVSQGGGSGAAAFLFAELNGTIAGWNSTVPPPIAPATSSTQAILAATGTPTPTAYTGLALGTAGSAQFLYAARATPPARIDVFDAAFTQVIAPGGFVDPNLPAGTLPVNIVNIGGSLYVTYSGPSGVSNVFDTEGNFIKRFAAGGTLLNPWGIVLAPADFGTFSNALLIGNFNLGNPSNGPGQISAFNASTGVALPRSDRGHDGGDTLDRRPPHADLRERAKRRRLERALLHRRRPESDARHFRPPLGLRTGHQWRVGFTQFALAAEPQDGIGFAQLHGQRRLRHESGGFYQHQQQRGDFGGLADSGSASRQPARRTRWKWRRTRLHHHDQL